MNTPGHEKIGGGEGNHEGDGGEKKLEGDGGEKKQEGEGGEEEKQCKEGGEEEEGGKEQEGESKVDPLTSLLLLELECPVCLSPMVRPAPAPPVSGNFHT